ncbi:type II secretion system GspH family protein [Verrucomicrobiales bacterium]|nr:type II secretion system GspH family protein [Verrucomicrobiales bacterium]
MLNGKCFIDGNEIRAFSIVELIIVVAILGIVTSIAVPQLGGVLSNSKEVLVKDFSENLNKAVKKHSQLNYDIKISSDNSMAGEEMSIIRTLQWRDAADPAPGAPFLRPDWHPVVSSASSDFRLQWNGNQFVVIWPGEVGVGLWVKFDGSDYGVNYKFPKKYVSAGR